MQIISPRLRFSALALLISAHLASQTQWSALQPPTAAGARCGAAMAYDLLQNRTMMFGGQGSNAAGTTLLNDTWSFDGSDWQAVSTPASPPVRHWSNMVYDQARDVLVLFGGMDDLIGPPTTYADTWEFDGNNWSQISTATTPPSRAQHGMVFDLIRMRTVMFGGVQLQGGAGTALNDTWEYDGTDWLQVATSQSPPPRSGAGMVFRWNGQTILFGGVSPSGPRNDTWFYDGIDWSQVTSATQPAQQFASHMTFDSLRDRCVLLANDSSTWEWDDLGWQPRATTTAPSMRQFANASFDRAAGQTVLFGGCSSQTSQPLNDTWTYRATNPATATHFGSACAGPFGPQMDVGSGAWLGADLLIVAFNLPPQSAAFFSLGLSSSMWNGTSLPYDLSAEGFTGCTLFISPDIANPAFAPFGSASLAYPIPSIPALIGSVLYAQALAEAPGANPIGWVTTDAIELAIGSK